MRRKAGFVRVAGSAGKATTRSPGAPQRRFVAAAFASAQERAYIWVIAGHDFGRRRLRDLASANMLPLEAGSLSMPADATQSTCESDAAASYEISIKVARSIAELATVTAATRSLIEQSRALLAETEVEALIGLKPEDLSEPTS